MAIIISVHFRFARLQEIQGKKTIFLDTRGSSDLEITRPCLNLRAEAGTRPRADPSTVVCVVCLVLPVVCVVCLVLPFLYLRLPSLQRLQRAAGGWERECWCDVLLRLLPLCVLNVGEGNVDWSYIELREFAVFLLLQAPQNSPPPMSGACGAVWRRPICV